MPWSHVYQRIGLRRSDWDPAIDWEYDAGYVRGLIGGRERDGGGYLRRVSETSHRGRGVAVDEVLMRIADALLSFPPLILAMRDGQQ